MARPAGFEPATLGITGMIPQPPASIGGVGADEWTRVATLLVERGEWDPLDSRRCLKCAQVPSDVTRCSGPLPRSSTQASPSATTSSRPRVAHRVIKPSRARSSNSSSGRHWELDQTPAVRGPTHIAEVGPGDSASDGDAQRRCRDETDACSSTAWKSASFRSRSRAFQNNTWSRNSRRVVPISRSTNGCDSGTWGTVLISSISSTRRCACQR